VISSNNVPITRLAKFRRENLLLNKRPPSKPMPLTTAARIGNGLCRSSIDDAAAITGAPAVSTVSLVLTANPLVKTTDGKSLQFVISPEPEQDSAIVLLNPLTGVTLTVKIGDSPAWTGALVGSALRMKSLPPRIVFRNTLKLLLLLLATAKSGAPSRLKSPTTKKTGCESTVKSCAG
jgi:hypothetical protein